MFSNLAFAHPNVQRYSDCPSQHFPAFSTWQYDPSRPSHYKKQDKLLRDPGLPDGQLRPGRPGGLLPVRKRHRHHRVGQPPSSLRGKTLAVLLANQGRG